jgi:hypothetical protein
VRCCPFPFSLRNANHVLHTNLFLWAKVTVIWCPWAKAFYEHYQQRGMWSTDIYRRLAAKWTRILTKCWQTRQPYDEAKWMESLKLLTCQVLRVDPIDSSGGVGGADPSVLVVVSVGHGVTVGIGLLESHFVKSGALTPRIEEWSVDPSN